jgi:glutathione S-transferase
VAQWSTWAVADVQPVLMAAMHHIALLPEAERRPKDAEDATRAAADYLKVLEPHLEGREFLLFGRFTIADINVSSVVNLAMHLGVPMPPATGAWLERMRARPAYGRAVQKSKG